jgi:hypothetical protein
LECATRFIKTHGAWNGGNMLNVLRHSQKLERPFIVGYVAAALGLLLGLALTFWQVQLAELDIPLLQQEKRQWEMVLSQATPTSSEVEGLQVSLTQAKQRVQALDQRQSMRLDLQEVQALLFSKKPIENRNQIRMQKLRWQGGRFEWEGTSLSPEALQALLLQANSFDRWHTQPKFVQVQSAVFKLEGQLDVDLADLPWASQQP